MQLTISIETIAASISIEWKVAHNYAEAGNWKAAHHAFRGIADMLDGQWNLLNWSTARSDELKDELMKDLVFLNRICHERISMA